MSEELTESWESKCDIRQNPTNQFPAYERYIKSVRTGIVIMWPLS